ncbi:MAG: Flp pilus assembly protein CpaB [Chloroflexi bacterium]|nr:MAG: Flp pilus assembly protein CpaB [Chloroflexota bacterium]RLC90858.1 MAG: Flp pilus assembly protein CpaB [Chloroflexota bacterium]HEY66805.1 Flp pilus assembly protein CpaB [Thermoflexia bacterium]
MRGGRILIIVGGILFVGALAVGLLLLRSRGVQQATTPVPEGTPQPELPTGVTEIVVAVQNIPRGMRITEDINAVALQSWPADAVPEGAITDLEAVYGRVARVDIVREMPLLEDMLTEEAGDMGAVGSDAALRIPPGKVAYALPVARYSSVAWALRPGDHVDIILSLLMVDLDEETQTILPNNMACISPPEGEGCVSGPMGRLEVLPNGWLVNVTSSEGQRPRLVTQLTVQDAEVLYVGEWPMEERPPAEGEELPEEQQPTPPPRAEVEPLILIVTRQDAIVLDYALAAGARINLLLRSAGETGPVTTESVTLQYIMERFNIELPPKLPYGTTPPLMRLERIPKSEAAGQYGGGE